MARLTLQVMNTFILNSTSTGISEAVLFLLPQSLQPSQNEQSQSVGGILPGSCSVSFLTEFYLPSIVSFRSAKQHVERHPKLFFVSTSSTTSTLSTASLCYVTYTGFTGTCSGRKRRAINFDGASVDESEFKPSQLKEDVQSSMEKNSLDGQGRFLLYWITTTSISTSTSFTTTFTVSSALCTPAGASICG